MIAAHLLDAIVAGLMAVEVVEALEVIDVDENDLDRLRVALRLLPEPPRQRVEHAPVVEAAQAVAFRDVVQAAASR